MPFQAARTSTEDITDRDAAVDAVDRARTVRPRIARQARLD
jgi:hypothetical protein